MSNTEGFAFVLVDRSYDQRVKAIIAHNTCVGDLDDKLDAAWRAAIEASPSPSTTLTTEREAAIAERDALRADAERYRWLREASWNGGIGAAGRREKSRTLTYKDGTGDTLFQIHFWGSPTQLDAAIDAKRALSAPAVEG